MLQLRLAIFTFRNRGLLTRVIYWSILLAVGVPVAVALFAVAVLAGRSPTGPGGAARPMPTWVVTQQFGCTGFPFEPRLGTCDHFHSGIDLAAAAGTPVSSVLAGTALVLPPSGPGGGYGLHVIVVHDGGLSTLYGHLAATAASSGLAVRAGDVIGYEGSTGLSTGPHLHFEVRRADVALDPVLVFPAWFATPATPSNQPAPGSLGTVP